MLPLQEETKRFLAAWMHVRQMIQAANFNHFQRAGLSATQFMTLNVIPKQGMTLAELARRLNLSAATLSETVNSLEERSFVSRTRSEGCEKVDYLRNAAGRTDAELGVARLSSLYVGPL